MAAWIIVEAYIGLPIDRWNGGVNESKENFGLKSGDDADFVFGLKNFASYLN